MLEFLEKHYEGPGNFFSKVYYSFDYYKATKVVQSTSEPALDSEDAEKESVDDAYTEDEFEQAQSTDRHQ